MPELTVLALNIVTSTEQIKEVGEAANETANQINRVNEAIKSTFELNLRELERSYAETQNRISGLLNSIEKSRIDISNQQNELELLQDTLLARLRQSGLEDLEAFADLLMLFNGPSSKQLADIGVKIDLSDELALAVKLLERLDKQDSIDTLENALKTNKEPLINQELTSNRKLQIENTIQDIQKRISELNQEISHIEEQVLLNNDPLSFEIQSIKEAIEKAQKTIEDRKNLIKKDEALINDEKQLLDRILQDREDLFQRIKDAGFQIEPNKLNLDLKPEDQQGLLQLPKQLYTIDKAGIAAAMSLDTMSDASVGLIGNVTDLNKDGINPLVQRSGELGNTVEQASGQIEQAQSSLKAYGADAENVSVLSVSLKENLGNLAVQNKDVAQSQDSVTNSVENAGAAMDNAAESTGEFANQNKLAAETLNSLQVFAADIAANINDTFADLIFNGLKGNFDNLLDFWKSALDSMLNVFAQFIATVISNPIRIGLEGFLSGTAAGGGGGPGGPGGTNILSGLGGLVGGIGSGIGSSFGALGSLFGLGGSKSNNGGGGGYESEAEIVETGLGNVIEFPKKHILCSNRGNYKIAA